MFFSNNNKYVVMLQLWNLLTLFGIFFEALQRSSEGEMLWRAGANLNDEPVARLPGGGVALKRLNQDIAFAGSKVVVIHLKHAVPDAADPLPGDAIVEVVPLEKR